ncbi:MAG: hypothetical protein QGD89_09205, partial [Actinomycetota bacterium]|nr:hypothetical protein [Actinomycetota bacterium]
MPVGKIVATIIANSGPFTAGLKKAGASAKGFSLTVGGVMKKLAKLGAAATVAGVAILSALVVKGMKAVDAQAKLARSVDGTQRGLVGLTRAAKDAGVAEEDVGKAAQMLNRRLGEAQARVGLASKAFDTLGLSAKELSEIDVDERFAVISDAMNEAGMSSAQMSSTLGDLGIRTREMVLLMQGGGDAIRAATKEMDAYGVAVNEIDAAIIESVNDAWDRGTDALTGIANTMAVEVAPIIGTLLKMFKDSSKEAGGFKDAIGTAFDAAVTGAGFVADAIHTI